MSVQILDGRIVISDCSDDDDYKTVLALMATIGIKQDIQTESWCG